jgi:hypothetical protein
VVLEKDGEDQLDRLYSPTTTKFPVPWFLGLFLGLFGALIQKNALDRTHQL